MLTLRADFYEKALLHHGLSEALQDRVVDVRGRSSWDKTARVWDVASGKEIAALRGHEDRVNSAAFSPNGASVVTASWDKPRGSGTQRPARRSSRCADTKAGSIPPRSPETARAS